MPIELKSISKLIDEKCKFIIPEYQRGYRWRNENVTDLLNDIKEFLENRSEKNEDEIYCLQPLVVKKRVERIDNQEDISYELIDGQQRLTTLKILLSHLGLDSFSIEYKTRKKSKEFLENLCSTNNPQPDDDIKNIDFYFMNQARNTIKNWLTIPSQDFMKLKLGDFIKYFQFIWYETEEESGHSAFIRLNAGKIPLLDSELIKSDLLLNSGNERDTIAKQWIEIDLKLMVDNFFLFFFGALKKSEKHNRMSSLLGLYHCDEVPSINLSSYSDFKKKLSDKKKLISVSIIWREIREIFIALDEVQNERELYHQVGFLLNCKNPEKLKYIINKYKKYDKLNYKNELKRIILQKTIQPEKIKTLTYGDSDTLYNVLFLFNILFYYSNDFSESFFPFEKFNQFQPYHIEHIRPRKPKEEEYIDWLKIVAENLNISFIDDEITNNEKEIISEINLFISKKNEDLGESFKDEFNKLYDKIIKLYQQNSDTSNEDDKISNLALLDENTNTGYKNSLYHIKKFILFKKEIEVLPATLKTFLKKFSKDPRSHTINYWTVKDAQDYEEYMFTTIKKYLG
jgi:hypothetical protein